MHKYSTTTNNLNYDCSHSRRRYTGRLKDSAPWSQLVYIQFYSPSKLGFSFCCLLRQTLEVSLCCEYNVHGARTCLVQRHMLTYYSNMQTHLQIFGAVVFSVSNGASSFGPQAILLQLISNILKQKVIHQKCFPV